MKADRFRDDVHKDAVRRFRAVFLAGSLAPAFFMAGRQLAQQVKVEEARSILREGIEEARRQGDHHAAGEMSEFLVTLGTAEPS